MKLTTRQDIEAPLDFVYDQMADFGQFERLAQARGAEVERLDKLVRPAPGMGWRLKFPFRGKPRNLILRLTDLNPGSALGYSLESPMFEGTLRIDLIALAPKRTRLAIAVEVRPLTMAARLLIQSLKLAKGRVQGRLDQGAARLAAMIEDRCRASARR